MKNNYKTLTLLFGFFLLFGATAHAQYPLSNRLFHQNKFGINAAYAGELENTRLTLVGNFASSQLADAASYWQQLTLDLPLKSNLSTGTRISNKTEGFLSQQIIEQALAYKIHFSKDQSLSFGISFGISRQSIDNKNRFYSNEYVNPNDPIFNTDLLTQNNLRIEIGAVYKQREFEMALAMPSIVQNKNTYRGLTAYIGYNFYSMGVWKLTPSVLMMKTYFNNYEITTGLNIEYDKKTWIKLSYINSDQLSTGVGIQISKLGLAYNYLLPLDSNYSTLQNKYHQIALYYNF